MRPQNEVGEMAPDRAANIQDLDGGTAVSRRRAMTIVGAVAGLPLLCAHDRSQSAPLLHQWTGTSLGSPSQLLLYHYDSAAAARKLRDWSAFLRSTAPIARSLDSTVMVASSFRLSICSRYSRGARVCLRSAAVRLT